jgi:Leucine-rich repeat (LRR) protein
MKWLPKKTICAIALILIMQQALSQDAIPVFRSKSDSSAYYSNREAMRYHDPLSKRKIRMDSLWEVQQLILRTGILGWRYTYRPDKTFVQFQELIEKRIDPRSIKKLSIVGYTGKTLPIELFACKNLEELELINTKLEKIPKRMNRLSKLRSVEIYNNHSTKKLRLARNTHVTFLKLRSDQPAKTPANFAKFKALDSLDLSRNFLTAFPVVSRNKNLRQLVLSENNLTLENLEVKRNETLQGLYLRRNKIQILPDAIGNFTGLKKLSLNYNEIKEVKDGIANLQNLEELSLYQNKLTGFPNSFYALKNLKVIDLYYNQIEKIEDHITNLSNLEILYLANNRIHSLSDNIGNLPNLRELYLHHNRISYFPSGFAKLATLKVLRLNDNYFAAFPDQILSLKNLENLDISRNRLQNIPTDFGAYEKLQLLVMTENPWEDKDTITAFAKKMRSNGTLVHLNSLSSEIEETIPEK